jgi:hypothetical protein
LCDGPAWRWFALHRPLPPLARDLLYAAIARNRYRLFGRTCLRPEPGWATRVVSEVEHLPKPEPLWPDEGGSDAVRALHAPARGLFVGRADVTAGARPLGRALARIAGFPRPGRDVPVTVSILRKDGRETWIRHFGGRRLISRITRSPHPDAAIRERLLGLACDIALVSEGGTQRWIARRWAWFGIPIPMRLAPAISAREGNDVEGRYTFAVEVRWLTLGTLIRYDGWLTPAGGTQSG